MGGALDGLVAVYVSFKEAGMEGVARAQEASVEALLRAPARGVLVLKTCNRVEVYMDSPGPGALELALRELRRAGVEPRIARGREAALRLMRIAAGLESRIVGEPEILAQVKDAWRVSRELGRSSRLLDKVLHAAILAGKRVRSETLLGSKERSYLAAAAGLAAEAAGRGRGRVLVVGAGGAGRELVARLCSDPRVLEIRVYSRSPARARSAAGQCRKARPLSSPSGGFDAAVVAVEGYPEGSLDWAPRAARLVIDLSVPPVLAGRLPGVLGLGDLESRVEPLGQGEWLERAERIVLEELGKLEKRLLEERAGRAIGALEAYASALAESMAGGGPEGELLRRFYRRLLHPLYVALRRAAASGASLEDLLLMIEEAYGDAHDGRDRRVPRVEATKAEGVARN